MPALITHHLFGERSVARLPTGLVDGEEGLLAFLLGNQGPDPFFFRFSATPARLRACWGLAHRMHDEHMTRAFAALRDGVGHLPEADAGVGRAFALGMLSHYALDRVAHPFVYAQQDAIIAAGQGLDDAASEVHAVIESDLDSWMLWRARRATVLDCPPAGELVRTGRIERVAGALMSQVAWAAFAIPLGATEYGASVGNMELVYRLIEPAGSGRSRAIGTLERLGRPHSQLESLAHRVVRGDDCPAANLGHAEWVSPFDGTSSHESFDERFEAALADWPALAAAFTHGGDGLRQAVGGLNYSGMRLGEDETLA